MKEKNNIEFTWVSGSVKDWLKAFGLGAIIGVILIII